MTTLRIHYRRTTSKKEGKTKEKEDEEKKEKD